MRNAIADHSSCRVLKMDFPDQDAWRNELEGQGELEGDAGHTSAELAEQFGVPRRSMRYIISRGLSAGRYIRGTGIRVDARGARQKVTVYRLDKPARKRRRA